MKKKKRFLSMLMAFVLGIITALAAPVTGTQKAMADNEEVVLVLNVDSAGVKAGDELTATVYLVSNAGLAGMAARIHYDTDVLSLVSVTPANGSAYTGAVLFPVAELLEDKNQSLDEAAAGTIGFSYGEALQTNKKDIGGILTAKFMVKQAAKHGESSLSFVYADAVDVEAAALRIATKNVTFHVAATVTVEPEPDNEENGQAAMAVSALVEKLLAGDEVKGFEPALAEALENAVAAYKTIKVSLQKTAVREEEVAAAEKEQITSNLSEAQQIAGYYEVLLKAKIDGEEIGYITELEQVIPVSVELSPELPAVTEGKFRKYSVMQTDGVNTTLVPAAAADGQLNFKAESLGSFAVIYEDTEGLLGDVNVDGEVDIADALLISRYDAGLVELNESQLALADVNDDGEADIADALLISRYDAGLIEALS